MLIVMVYVFYRRMSAHDVGRSVGNFKAASKPEEPPRKVLGRSEPGALEKNLNALDLKPGATFDQVKSAYRELVKVWHPDRFGNDAKLKERANAKLMEINAAYERLKEHFEK